MRVDMSMTDFGPPLWSCIFLFLSAVLSLTHRDANVGSVRVGPLMCTVAATHGALLPLTPSPLLWCLLLEFALHHYPSWFLSPPPPLFVHTLYPIGMAGAKC